MNNYYITYQEDLYEIFFEISPDEYREKELFYNQYRTHLDHLEDEQILKVRTGYIEALFFLGKYHKLLREIERDLLFVIDKNIVQFEEKDVYQWLLMFKGAAHFNIGQYQKAIHVFQQLAKIAPSNLKIKKYLFRSLLQKRHPIYRYLVITSLAILGGSLLLSISEVAFRGYFPEIIPILLTIRNISFVGGIALFLVTSAVKYISNYLMMRQYIQTH